MKKTLWIRLKKHEHGSYPKKILAQTLNQEMILYRIE